MLTRLSQFALIATFLASSGCYHHHYHDRDDDGWRDQDHRYSQDRDHRRHHRHDDRYRDEDR
ncbi:hypothetical protein [Pseudomonas sp. HLS-6]|uniref:hypothetical protein n=1 Tax=unclassified Pseudomonas TaxID=196821 RepID=UPI002115152E|nr:hypothetical protein [Pseudomonas sp. HLS-6]